ncbi:NAD(P)H-quinone oxidoreductase subunit N, chloroplastic-like [Olea europaea var. sylvestris]|uniref:NAD(P)H-quinone oxidoreductase subunit N, chloroplastic-like n=1 Tax=Olea europaea var. sylvestris TaxID=158386 RepID=UPI000C1D03F2|nr:NAD(P)H-quinone oxidoreductase subunit N, chloroplastic-like [Olea europaea var. sylvestris]
MAVILWVYSGVVGVIGGFIVTVGPVGLVEVRISWLKHSRLKKKKKKGTRCSIGIEDFIGRDLIKVDLGKWLSDVEEHKALAIYSPHEGGYEGWYLNRLRYQGYHFLDLSACGLGDLETTLTKFHPVCPLISGSHKKQPIARWYFPPEVDYRLSLLPPNAKGLVVWIIEAKVLSKAELQFLALLPSPRLRVRVIAECGNWNALLFSFCFLHI